MAFKGKKSKFEYQPRSAEQVKARATAGGNREGFLVEGTKVFSPKAGSHTVRILPPTWEDPDHYGYDIFAHYNIGPDHGNYLCLQKMKDEPCAICDDRARAAKEQDEELERALKPNRRIGCWVIDRDDEREGPQFWTMPPSLDVEISKQSIDKKTQEVYNLDDPDEGYDVSFERQGEALMTKYVGVQLERKPSPLSDDDDQAQQWLEFVATNPVPNQLVFQEPEYLAELVGEGLVVAGDRKEKEKDEPKKGRESKDNGARTGKAKKKDEIDTSQLDYDAVHAMDEAELLALAEQEQIDIENADDEKDAARIICEALDLKPPKKEPSERPKLGSKLAALRARAGK